MHYFFYRLVPKPNCVKVPKEICVNTKKNPRRVKKPVVKEWCYRPKDLLENPGTFADALAGGSSADTEADLPPEEAANEAGDDGNGDSGDGRSFRGFPSLFDWGKKK